MVRALLAGTKTQTRRLVRELGGNRGRPVGDHVKWFEPGREDPTRWCGHDGLGSLGWVRCPYGVPGDVLWVRETWTACRDGAVVYRADGGGACPHGATIERWRSPIHMPRAASRLTLAVTSVRVERLQDLTEDAARAEACAPRMSDEAWSCFTRDGRAFDALVEPDDEMRRGHDIVALTHYPVTLLWSARQAFANGWDAMHGKRAPWASNPWVFVVSFGRLS